MSQDAPNFTRRGALLLTASGGASTLAGSALASDSTKTAAHQDPGNCSTPGSVTAQTQYGKVRGFLDGGVFTFKGVPYGQDSGGKNRWLPAKPPAPWQGERHTLIYGPNCPQTLHDFKAIETLFPFTWTEGYLSEDRPSRNI